MSVIFNYQARNLHKMIDANHETQAHLYLEQLLLLPVDIQDKIIEEVSHLPHCTSDAVATIINRYTMMNLK